MVRSFASLRDRITGDSVPNTKRLDRKPFAFGGLWERREFNGQPITTFAVFTTTPNKLASLVHNNGLRMPVYVPEEVFDQWLYPSLSKEEVLALCGPAPDDLFEACRGPQKASGQGRPERPAGG